MPLDGTEGVTETFGHRRTQRFLTTASGTANTVDRIEFIIGSRQANVPVDALLDNLQIEARIGTPQELKKPHSCRTKTVLVQDSQALATILHPDSPAGEHAAATVATADGELRSIATAWD